MSGHTPGPWKAGCLGNNRVYGPDFAGDDSGLIAVVYKGRGNINLIAAAPDLYSEAILARDKIGGWLSAALDDPNSCSEFKADIREWMAANAAAIAKAEGKS